MIDLHCHLLPGLDDGAPNLETALKMARVAVADGIGTIACTPHIHPGVYNNSATGIQAAVTRLSLALDDAQIPLHLVVGADVHLAPDLLTKLKTNQVPCLAGSSYFLLEPPHHSLPPRLLEFAFGVLAGGFVPILTHPERLAWIDGHFDVIARMADGGTLMQVTAGSFTGDFGRRARYWAERLLAEGLVDLIATDAHHSEKRPPILSKARDLVAKSVGDDIALRLVAKTPLHILQNVVASKVRQP